MGKPRRRADLGEKIEEEDFRLFGLEVMEEL